MAQHFLEFEKPVVDILSRIEDLRGAQAAGELTAEKNIPAELDRLTIRMARVTRLLYRNLDPLQKVQVARHPERPQGSDYIKALVQDFVPLAGDRLGYEDRAIVGGVGRLLGTPVMLLAIDKGKNTQERLARNFGMPKPDGYRKAQRLMKTADRLGLPVVTLVDTPGAYPGIDAEERGQGGAIAESLEVLMQLKVPVVSVITGEGGSGGALALAAADKVLMLEHSIYSVISPEGCAAILWKEANKDTVALAAHALKLTAQDLFQLKVIDGVVREPVGGAHRDPALTMQRVGEAVQRQLAALLREGNRQKARRLRFLEMGR